MNSESLNSSPTNDYHIIDHHSLEGGDESALRSLSNNGEDDVSSIDTIDAAHDQSHPSQYKNLPDEVGILSTPPTARSNRDCPKTKGKSTSRKIVHIRGPTRLRNMIGSNS